MIQKLKVNPIVQLAISQRKWPGKWGLVLLGIAGLVGQVGISLGIQAFNTALFNTSSLNMTTAATVQSGLFCIIPPFILLAVVMGAALLTRQTVQSEGFQMVRLGLLEDRQIIRGLMAAAVYRLRGILILAVGAFFSMPVVLLITLIQNWPLSSNNFLSPAYFVVVLVTFIVFGPLILLSQYSLALAGGTVIGLAIRDNWLAILLSGGGYLLLVYISRVFMAIWNVAVPVEMTYIADIPLENYVVIFYVMNTIGTLLAYLPYLLLAWWLLYTGERWVTQPAVSG